MQINQDIAKKITEEFSSTRIDEIEMQVKLLKQI